jgi:glycerol-3-phosphate dehydrogenase
LDEVRPIKWIDPDVTKKDKYDLIIIGGGKNGIKAAIRGRQLGLKVALVE